MKVAQSIRSMFALMVTGCLLQMTVRFQKLITKPVNVLYLGSSGGQECKYNRCLHTWRQGVFWTLWHRFTNKR